MKRNQHSIESVKDKTLCNFWVSFKFLCLIVRFQNVFDLIKKILFCRFFRVMFFVSLR